MDTESSCPHSVWVLSRHSSAVRLNENGQDPVDRVPRRTSLIRKTTRAVRCPAISGVRSAICRAARATSVSRPSSCCWPASPVRSSHKRGPGPPTMREGSVRR